MILNIPLTQEKFAVIDDADWDKVHWYSWHAVKSHGTWYARAYVKGSGRTKQKRIYMHRLITGAPDGMQVDHRDGNGLNNRRSNLRVCSNMENSQNAAARPGQSSKYKGVFRRSRDKFWTASIVVEGETIYLGRYLEEKNAAKAYNRAAKKHFGEFAWLNDV